MLKKVHVITKISSFIQNDLFWFGLYSELLFLGCVKTTTLNEQLLDLYDYFRHYVMVKTETQKATHSVNTVKLIKVIQMVTSPLKKICIHFDLKVLLL